MGTALKLNILQEESKVKKFQIKDVEHLIEVLQSLRLNKAMAIFNIERYGYQEDMEYILNSLGFSYNKRNKIKVSKEIQKQAELFQLLFNINKNCFIRLRNKSTGQYRAYSVETLQDPYRLQAIIKSQYFDNTVDLMYSLNAYNNMYRADENSLFSLQNIALDVDYCKETYTLEEVLGIIQEEIKEDNLPAPNVMETGNRLRLIYSIQDVPVTKKSLYVYKKVTEKLSIKLEDLNTSPQPATTYARIEGSINSRNNSVITNNVIKEDIYSLRYLQLRLLDTVGERKKKARKGNLRFIGNDYTLNMDRLSDFRRIQKIRDIGYREALIYLYRNYCILANFGEEGAFLATKDFNANFKNPMPLNHWDGATKHLNRKQYLHKNQTILNLLDISHKEEEMLGLKTIISVKESKRRKKISDRNRYLENLVINNKLTKKEQIEKDKLQVKSLLDKGFKQKYILEQLKISKSTYIRLRKYLKEDGLL